MSMRSRVCHSERSAKREVEESAFDYVSEKQISHFVRNDIPARLNTYRLKTQSNQSPGSEPGQEHSRL